MPRPGALSISSSPSTKCTRSRIPARPRLGRSRLSVASKPQPSSWMANCNPPSSSCSDSVICCALAWRAAFRNASWATRNRQRAASGEIDSGTSRILTLIGLAPCRSKRSASAFNASASPRSSRMEGCSRYERACTSSLNWTKPSLTARRDSTGGSEGVLFSHWATSIASLARR